MTATFITAPAVADLDDDTLAELVRARRDDALAELEERYRLLAERVARRICSRISHRGGPCRGNCGGAYPVAEILDLFCGHDKGETRHGVTHTRTLKGLFVRWADRDNRDLDFEQYVWANDDGWDDNGLRWWNVTRGLKARLRCNDVYNEGVSDDAVDQLFRLLVEHDRRFAAGVAFLGVAASRLLDALWRDACQPAYTTIDAVRVARRVTKCAEPSLQQVARTAAVAARFDEALETAFPEWHNTYLGCPRQQTRELVLDEALTVPQVDADDFGDDDLDEVA